MTFSFKKFLIELTLITLFFTTVFLNIVFLFQVITSAEEKIEKVKYIQINIPIGQSGLELHNIKEFIEFHPSNLPRFDLSPEIRFIQSSKPIASTEGGCDLVGEGKKVIGGSYNVANLVKGGSYKKDSNGNRTYKPFEVGTYDDCVIVIEDENGNIYKQKYPTFTITPQRYKLTVTTPNKSSINGEQGIIEGRARPYSYVYVHFWTEREKNDLPSLVRKTETNKDGIWRIPLKFFGPDNYTYYPSYSELITELSEEGSTKKPLEVEIARELAKPEINPVGFPWGSTITLYTKNTLHNTILEVFENGKKIADFEVKKYAFPPQRTQPFKHPDPKSLKDGVYVYKARTVSRFGQKSAFSDSVVEVLNSNIENSVVLRPLTTANNGGGAINTVNKISTSVKKIIIYTDYLIRSAWVYIVNLF